MSRIWTNDEIEYLREAYQRLSDSELAVELHRSVGAIEKKREALNLRRTEPKSEAYKKYVPRGRPVSKPVIASTCPFEVNRQLIIDWFREHGERGYGDYPVNYRQILEFYKDAAA